MSSFKSIYWRVRITHRSLRRPKFCSFKYQSYTKQNMTKSSELYTATSRKVVGKSARDNPERYCGWVWVRCSSQKFERMTREAMDVCLRVLKEGNKRIFDSYSARNSVLIISNITFRDCRVHIFDDSLSRNSCICCVKWMLILTLEKDCSS